MAGRNRIDGAWMAVVVAITLATTLPATAGDEPAKAVSRITLETSDVVLAVTPALGGRVLHFGRRDAANLIKVGDAVQAQPTPEVSADADDIGYLGHDVWLGPQSGWWNDQSANAVRRDAAANWPPDPYLALATTKVVEHDARRLVLEGVDSPVTGVRLTKTFVVDAGDPATLHVDVSAINIRDRPVARDLWFNTRVSAALRAYVPVAGPQAVRVESSADAASLAWHVDHGLLTLAASRLPEGRDTRRGKAFVQPSAGWMAAFADDQVFIIRFAHQAADAIHPEHGQVELYLDHGPDVASGLLELEVHAPFRTLAPGQSMRAGERWTALRYDGDDSAVAHAAFLCRLATRWNDATFCPGGAGKR